jgi:putative transposase
VPWPDPERRRAAVERLGQLREAGELTTEHVRLAASRLEVRERTVWRWLSLAAGQPGVPAGRVRYQLSEADREAYARYRGNAAAVHRARSAVLASPAAPVVLAAGVPVPASLREGWRGAPPVTERTLQRAFRRELGTSPPKQSVTQASPLLTFRVATLTMSCRFR